VAAETVRETTGPAAAILLEPDRATIAGDGDDVSLVTVQVVDAAGRTVPTANATITFAVSGAGRLIGLGNGDPSSHEADKGSMRSVFNGLAQAIVQSDGRPGELRLDASSPGLASGSVVVTCAPAAPRPSA
jgi:beta-galactosidase